MHPIPPPLPAHDAVTSPKFVLRDGSVASVRPATDADRDALRQFFRDLSPESRFRRFLSVGEPSDALTDRLLASADVTFLAERTVDGATKIIATASAFPVNADSAEVAFAVADAFQGKGLGTALLERLAVVESSRGFVRFQATTLSDNRPMLEVFRDSGFQIRSKTQRGSVELQLSLAPSSGSVAVEEERNRAATAASLRPLLEPTAIAVVGASRDPSGLGHRVLAALVAGGFKGSLSCVNPRATDIEGVKAYRSARDLPRDIDLAVIAVPAPAVLGVVNDCAAAGVKSLVVISAGFAEAGAEGRQLQEQLTENVRNHGMRMIGPNCMGVLNASPGVSMNASFAPIFPPSGHVGFLSQSGALGLAILDLAKKRQLGLSTFVSVGNKADVSGNDLLEYWDGDAATRVILLYLESFGNPRRFARLARRVGRHKPIVAVKSGRTRAGSRAASSHTAALAASDVAVDALFHQTGVIRADTLDEMFDVAACLDLQPLPSGPRIAIVTNAGGPGILAADACEAARLALAEFSPETQARLSSCLPPMASRGNPVDMIASAGPDQYRRAIETVLTAPETDAVIIIYTPVDAVHVAETLQAIREGVEAGRRAGALAKPVVACLMASSGQPAALDGGAERFPTYAFPENAARALGKVTEYARWRSQMPGLLWDFDDLNIAQARAVCRAALERPGEGWLADREVQQVLSAFGLPLAPSAVAATEDDAAAMAAVMGYPVVAKLSSSRVQHKTELGAVRLNLRDAAAVRAAFGEILAAGRGVAADDIDGVLIQPMVTGGIETMMGIVQDPIFGPLLAFGLGGIFVEAIGDVRFRVAPVTDRDVDELLHEIRGVELLKGYRGRPAADMEALRDVVLRLSRLADELPEVAELDLNPVIAMPPGHGCRIVDARIRVRRSG